MTPAEAPAHGFVLKGWHVLAVLLVSFGVMFAVNGWFVYRAYTTFPGEVVAKPFEEGVGFNGEIHRRAAAQALGWKARLTDHVEGGRAELTLAVRDAQGRPLTGLHPVGQISRTVTLSGRQSVTFTETQPGVYAANVAAPSGLSELELKAKGPNGADFELEQRFVWP
jgi:nitrogen fixation protein FixH